MKLSEVFDSLTHGELFGLAIGGKDNGGIQVPDYPRVISNINLGLIELYTEFPLRNKILTIQLYEAIKTYRLHSDFAVSNVISIESPKFILDSGSPFNDDIMLIDSVITEDNEECLINRTETREPAFAIPSTATVTDITKQLNVSTSNFNEIYIPFAKDSHTIDIHYRASPTTIDTTATDLSNTWVPIPYQLLSCLIPYVLHKIHSTMGNIESTQAGMYYKKYLVEVARIKNLGLSARDDTESTQFELNGWI